MSFDLKIRNRDLQIGSDGDFEKVENNDKLIQDIIKLILTPIGSNLFFPWYGSPVNKSLVGSALDFQTMSNITSNNLRNSLETLQKLQRAQVEAGQVVSPGETLAAIQEIRIERNQVDPRFFSVTVKALTKALTSATVGFQINPIL